MAAFELSPGRWVGEGHPFYVIAEGGINHQGQLSIAKQLIEVAKSCGADCVKFQKRTVERILTKEGLDMPYVNDNSFGATYGEHKRALELDFEAWKEMKAYADTLGIAFSASGWDEESIDFLDSLNIPFFKMASADLTNFPLLIHTAKKGKPMVISTGMADLATVKKALDVILPLNPRVVVLQCTSTYPSKYEEINLRVLDTYRKEFGDKVVIGYSGHEKGICITEAAVTLGAKVIERHFTLDRTMKGGDHAASLEPDGLRRLIRDSRNIEASMGNGIKEVQPGELPIFRKLAKSIVTAVDIPEGKPITRDMITTKGPGTGINPMKLDQLLGKTLNKTITADKVIKEEDVNW